MKLQTYDNVNQGSVKVFFVVKNNQVTTVQVGNQVVPVEQGYQFYVDKNVALQIDKCELYMNGLTPKLRLKEGETLDVPEKTAEELRIEQLKQEIYELENAE